MKIRKALFSFNTLIMNNTKAGGFSMKERDVAIQILEHIGGEENIKSVEHCATRLRLILKDDSKFDAKAIEAIDGVKGQFFAAGQYQIVLGTGFVNKVYAQIAKGVTEEDAGNESQKNMSVPQKISRTIGDVFVPIIPILVATGLFMGLRTLITNLGVTIDPTVLTLSQVLIDTAFAFLPALVGYSTMKRFGGSPVLGLVVGLMLVAPQLPNANQVAAGTAEPLLLNLFGLAIPITGYQGSILPALILTMISAKIERSLRKIVPDVLDLIVTPFITLLASMILGLLVIGPVMHQVESLILAVFQALLGLPLGLGGLLIGALQQVVVITGLHHTFKALEIELLASTGANPFNAIVSCAIAAQGAATIAAALKTKNLKKRSLYLSSALPAFLGITEPAIFGVNLKLMKPFAFACVGGGIGGLLAALFGLAGTGMSITVIPGMLLYLNGQLPFYLLCMLVAMAVSFGLTYVFYKSEEE